MIKVHKIEDIIAIYLQGDAFYSLYTIMIQFADILDTVEKDDNAFVYTKEALYDHYIERLIALHEGGRKKYPIKVSESARYDNIINAWVDTRAKGHGPSMYAEVVKEFNWGDEGLETSTHLVASGEINRWLIRGKNYTLPRGVVRQ